MRKEIIGILICIILFGCSNNTKIIFNPNIGSQSEDCLNPDDPDAEKDCFLSLICETKDFDICERMPVDTNDRQTNKGFCLAFVTSLTHDLSYCKDQENPFYANTCEMVYQRWMMSFEQAYENEFRDLREKYGCS
jgi:hypothetical protein